MVQIRVEIRAIGAVVLSAAVVLSLGSCVVVAEKAPAWRITISQALKKLEPVGDEFGTMKQPAPVDDLAGGLKASPAQGLTPAEADMIARADEIVLFWKEVTRVSTFAGSVADFIPEDAIRLVSLRLAPNSHPDFVRHVNGVADKALKGLTCNMAHELLDLAGQDAVADLPLTYDPTVGFTNESVLPYFAANLAALGYDLNAVDETFDAYGFSFDAIGRASEWTDAITGVIESPDQTTQRAYVYYIRLCLMPAR
ncbi:hypothetical protein E3O62_02815 [Cryobacterium sp. TMT2-15-1]|uniref:hypothetical protein n=1 Tax=Cryobacterium sp. TMT2-15-1 TaxID=1259246 RepID=UPI0010691C02|nr:hypothetical protein [Cryobacterium sp. TMT2-15-1]TFC63506.1 hypothetical protein E3O62_02815 [Cryobacterium sp. TMT2-15-1]